MRVVGEAFRDSNHYLEEAERLLDRGFIICLVDNLRILNELLVAYKQEEAEDIILFVATIREQTYYQFFLRKDIIKRIVKIPRNTIQIVVSNNVKCIIDSKENAIRNLEESVNIFRLKHRPESKLYHDSNNVRLDISKGEQYYIFRGRDAIIVFAWSKGLLDKELIVDSINSNYTIHLIR
ncbi:MAG: hypothetical protein KatS3mg003_0708 [Candidatus Nitrosocaldaceae archaeon]|nr:MAG: hypothetical protein KatS3mg003_0708 [Candidatus Nitrosocaldaceae archaeon]